MNISPILRRLLISSCILLFPGWSPSMAEEEVVATARSAETSGLVKQANLEMLESMVKRSGDTVESADLFNENTPRIQAKTEGGMIYFLFGTACSEDGHCKGIEAQAVFAPGEGRTYDLKMANELNIKFGAVSIFLTEGGNIGISRYMILDFGQDPQNVDLNLEIFLSISGRVSELLNRIEAES